MLIDMLLKKKPYSAVAPSIESLEDRRHFAASAVDPSGVTIDQSKPFALKVNFGSSATPKVAGYRTDYGAVYATRSNGFTYGWNASRAADAVYHDTAQYDSPRAESNILMSGSSTWNAKLPNGWYEVHILMAANNGSDDYRVNVEGQPIVKGIPFKGFPWIEGIKTVHLTDGKLTLTSDSKAINNRICSIAIVPVTAPKSTAAGTSIAWSKSSIKSPIYRAEAGSVRVGNKLYVMGGFTNDYASVTGRVDILNLSTGTWSKGKPLPGAQTHFGAATDGENIYVVAGQYGPELSLDGTNQAWKYNIATNTWSAFAALPAVRFGGQLSYMNGRLHFTGGDDRTRVRSQTEHWIFDLSRQKKGWITAAPLPMPTDHHGQIVVNNALYVVGGEVEHGTSYLQNSGLFRYNDSTNRWTRLADMPVAASHSEASTLTDGKRIFVIAGQANAQQLMSQVRSYDIANNRWVIHTSLPTARKAGIGWITGNKLFYTTGDDELTGASTSTYVGVIG